MRYTTIARSTAVAMSLALVGGCGSGGSEVGGATSTVLTTVAAVTSTTTTTVSPVPTTIATGTGTGTSTSTSTSTSSSTTSTTTTTTTVAPPLPPTVPPTSPPVSSPPLTIPWEPIEYEVHEGVSTMQLGTSVQGRPILVHRVGQPGGTAVLVVGVIHGNEDGGALIAERLLWSEVPLGVELWVVPSMNPDGQAAGQRRNVNDVDLNRNFPERWGPIAEPGDWQYAGPAPASEPETQAMLRLASLVRPDLVLWYHQDLFRITPSSGRDGAVRARYAELTGLPLVPVTGGTYTGTASIWSRTFTAPSGVGFTVELGPVVEESDAGVHAAAVLQVATEL